MRNYRAGYNRTMYAAGLVKEASDWGEATDLAIKDPLGQRKYMSLWNDRDVGGSLGVSAIDTGASVLGSGAAMLLGKGKVRPDTAALAGGLAGYMPGNIASNKYLMDRQEKQLSEDHPVLDALGVTKFMRPIDRTGI